MPIKGINSIEEQSVEKVESIYGQKTKSYRYANNPNKRVINDRIEIPYICDKTKKEFNLKWWYLERHLNEPHYFPEIRKTTKSDIQFIKENYPLYGPTYCAKKLKMSDSVICSYAKKLNLYILKEKIPEGYKKCFRCKIVLLYDKFTPKQCIKSGEGKCKECSKLYKQEFNSKIKNITDKSQLGKLNFIEKKCQKCSKIFFVMPSLNETALFCSRKCCISGSKKTNTSIEIKICNLLSLKGIEYISSYPIKRYVLDILIPKSNLVIECDGDYWHSTDKAKANDSRKDKFLLENGFKILRLTESEINNNIINCWHKIEKCLIF